jgi:hypothetical protein
MRPESNASTLGIVTAAGIREVQNQLLVSLAEGGHSGANRYAPILMVYDLKAGSEAPGACSGAGLG